MIYYKIRHKPNPNFYVKGTPSYHNYDKSGRIFQSLGQLRTFITGIMNSRHSEKLSDWEIVEYELQETAVKGVHEIITPKKLLEILAK